VAFLHFDILTCSTTLLRILVKVWIVSVNFCVDINKCLLTENIYLAWFTSASVFYSSVPKFGTFLWATQYMFSEGRASREITPVLHISRPSTSPLVWVVGPGCGSWSSESVLEDGVEDDGDDEHDDDDVEFDGDADQSLRANASAAPAPWSVRQLWNATSCSLGEQLAQTRTTDHQTHTHTL